PQAWTIALPDGGTHTVAVSIDGAKLVVTVDGVAESRALDAVSRLDLTGGSGDDTFKVDAAQLPVTIDGGSGDNTYKLNDGFGNVTLTGGDADTIDFSGNTGTIGHPDGATFTSSSGGTLTLNGDKAPSHIDLTLTDPTSFTSG